MNVIANIYAIYLKIKKKYVNELLNILDIIKDTLYIVFLLFTFV